MTKNCCSNKTIWINSSWDLHFNRFPSCTLPYLTPSFEKNAGRERNEGQISWKGMITCTLAQDALLFNVRCYLQTIHTRAQTKKKKNWCETTRKKKVYESTEVSSLQCDPKMNTCIEKVHFSLCNRSSQKGQWIIPARGGVCRQIMQRSASSKATIVRLPISNKVKKKYLPK